MVEVAVYANDEEHIFEFNGCKCELKEFLNKLIDGNKFEKAYILNK